ncbi:ribosome modulation factor [Vibrio owensii]
MNKQEQDIYQEGYNAYLSGESDTSNPYNDLDAEFWSDGWEDAQEDNLR